MWRTRQNYQTRPTRAEGGIPTADEELEVSAAEGDQDVATKSASPTAPQPQVPGNDVIQRIVAFNLGREPERLQAKYARMRASLFGFLRGTPHLFYQDWPADSPLDRTPLVWISGDLHLENFGSYKADNRLVYFDLSDFDDAALAPSAWELTRFVTSVAVAARSLGISNREAITLSQLFLRSYTAALRDGKPRWVERPTARGMVKNLLNQVKDRSRRSLLDDRTELNGKARRLCGKYILPAPEVTRGRIAAFMKRWAARQAEPEFFRLLDVARRVAGVSSLGLPRFVLLVEGHGSPHGNYLLDLKLARESCLTPFLKTAQPEWKNQAERIVAVQQRMQSIAPALLRPVLVNRQPYVLRELQPMSDRLTLELWGGKVRRLEKVMRTMGEIVAWAELRSSGRQGSATIDNLIAFATGDGWQQEVIGYARFYASRIESDYQEFSGAYDAGEFGEMK